MGEMGTKRLTRKWMNEFLEGAFPGVLGRCAGVGDFIRLLELQRRLYPAPQVIRPIIWVDNLEM